MSQRSDSALVEASRGGDRRAFAELVRRHHAAVYCAAFAISLRPEIAEDVTQESFLRGWTRLDSLRDSSKLRPWLLGIARNLSISELRRCKRDVEFEAVADADDPEKHLLAKEKHVALYAALDKLSVTDREALALFYEEGQSTRSVARTLGVSEAAAQKRISRARMAARGAAERYLADLRPSARVSAGLCSAVLVALKPRTSAAGGAGGSGGGKGTAVSSAPLKASTVFTVGACALAGVVALVFAVTESAANPAETSAAGVKRRSLRSGQILRSTPPWRKTKTEDGESEYRVEMLGEYALGIDLSGEGIEMPLNGDEPRPVVRHIRGTVRSASGEPLAGVIVMANYDGFKPCPFGSTPETCKPSLLGDAGTRTNEDGRYDLPLRYHFPGHVMAVAPGRWSAPAEIDNGAADEEHELVVTATARLRGRVTRRGKPVKSTVSLAHGGFYSTIVTDEDGYFEFPFAIPAGDVRLTVRDGTGDALSNGVAHRVRVTLQPGGERDYHVEREFGSKVTLLCERDPDLAYESEGRPVCIWTVFRGHVGDGTWLGTPMRRLYSDYFSGQSRVELPDLAGQYTICFTSGSLEAMRDDEPDCEFVDLVAGENLELRFTELPTPEY